MICNIGLKPLSQYEVYDTKARWLLEPVVDSVIAIVISDFLSKAGPAIVEELLQIKTFYRVAFPISIYIGYRGGAWSCQAPVGMVIISCADVMSCGRVSE